MEFQVLGPVEMWSGGQRIDAGYVKQRAVLAVLLLDLGKVVPVDVLIDRVWGDDPPAFVRNNLYAYVARLRAMIAGTGDTKVALSRRPGGYLLEADVNQVDLYGFRRGVRLASVADDQRAAELLSEALGLWRGQALAGMTSPWLASVRDMLEQERITAELDRDDIALRQGQHAALTSALAERAVTRPGDERLVAQLMTALYRSDRQAEALRWFEQTRRHLADELGADPGPELRALHQQILRNDPGLAGPVPAARRQSAPVPRELPADISAFTGRSAEFAVLDRLLGTVPEPAAVVISAVSGTAGVGKTALAVHWAHQIAGRFPDGQLFVNLRGYDPGSPVPAADALAGFLRSLGVPGQDIPSEEDERAVRYRSLLAGKRILVVLDNAESADQVRMLLPGSPSCTVVVTSRDALAGLVARDGATRLDLDVLPPADAVALLRTLIGARAAAEPEAVAELADRCCLLPLALRVAAELAASRPAISLAELAGELADLHTRLDLLEASGDSRTGVRAVLSWSIRHLDADAARTFRLAGLHPGPDLDAYAAAALTGTTLPRARRSLDVLARAHLLQPTGSGRYGMHDLLRGYARELSAATDTAGERRAALTRLLDHYLHTAAAAMDTLDPARRHGRPRIPRPASPVPPLADAVAARHWLDSERAVLVAAAGHAAEHGWPGHAIRLGPTLSSYLLNGSYLSEALTVFGHMLAAARRTGDRTAEATALNDIGHVDGQQGRFERSVAYFRQALALSRAVGDQVGEARALGDMGLAEKELGRYSQAARHLQEALAIVRRLGDRLGEARALGLLGMVRGRQGRYQEAVGYHQQALDLLRGIGDREGEAWALARLGYVDLRQGRYQQAAGYLEQALALFQEMGRKTDEAEILVCLGDVYLELARYEQAAANFERALAVFREIGDPALEAEALNGLGDVLFRTGHTSQACARHAAALRLASRASTPVEQARAHAGLARAHHADDDTRQARHHWQQALALYTAIGDPQAREIRAQLETAAP